MSAPSENAIDVNMTDVITASPPAAHSPEMGEEARSSEAPEATGGVSPNVLFGKYRLFANLGRGGMAEVFLALSRGPMGFNKLVVVKRLRAGLAEEPQFVRMFLDEARLAARLSHPNIVQTYEVGEERGSYFILMEYLEGQALNRVVARSKVAGKLPLAMWLRIVSDALSSLHYAHEARDYDGKPLGVVHRDISPHNIFVTYDGQAKLVDFGIAKAAMNGSHTETGMLKGKASYMAPEQARGRAVDRRADIFAMGVVMWEVATGTRLLPGETVQVLHKLMSAEIPRASSVVPDLDPALDAIIARALEKEPEMRFQTALEMREALEACLRAQGLVVEQHAVGQRLQEMFAQVREDIQRRIQENVDALSSASLPDHLPSAKISSAELVALGGAIDVTPTGPFRAPISGVSAIGGVVTRSGSPETSVHDAAPDPRERRARRVKLAVAIVGSAAVVGLLFTAAPRARVDASASAAPPSTATVPAARDKEVLVTSDPPGAIVDWRGHPVGRTPAQIRRPAGNHVVVLSLEGHAPEPVEIVVATDSTEPFVRDVKLRRREPEPRASAAPPKPEPWRGAPQAASNRRAPPAAPSAAASVVVAPPPPPPPPAVAAPVPATKLQVRVLGEDGSKSNVKVDILQ